jgi:S1-C subfamily serine protease
MAEVHRFIEMYEEDLAWQGDARSVGAGGFLAPSGGWPAWKGPASGPSPAQEGSALEGTELFKRLAPSVFQVVAKGSTLTWQGSAIAISNNELLTNCHVVAGALKVTLQQDKAERVAKLTSADPATDRCVLGVEEPTLTPVGGVRSYESLEVGEALFTLGSPSGLELSLANGLLSGKRQEGGRNFVQTTAPVSPGSSGGGLFDARGNLVGVTTKVNVGRTGLNQALNFAIPADDFWKTTE